MWLAMNPTWRPPLTSADGFLACFIDDYFLPSPLCVRNAFLNASPLAYYSMYPLNFKLFLGLIVLSTGQFFVCVVHISFSTGFFLYSSID